MADPQTHLLLVDDEAALRSVIAERLRDQGFDVIEAESGERAVELLSDFAFDVVISDLRLPGVDGRRVIEEALQRYPGIIAI
ncbi:MAG: response regulator, partial [Vicinamibacterales bacterium]